MPTLPDVLRNLIRKDLTVSSYLAAVFGIVSCLLGATVIAGWYLHSVTLIQVHPSFVPMQYNTALGFLLAGSGLLAAHIGKPKGALAFGIVTALLGTLTLIEYVSGFDLRIDQLFMEHYVTVKTSNPGRMAPNTALCFTLSGLATISLSMPSVTSSQRMLRGTLLGSVILGLGLIALAGYLVGVETAYGWGHLTRMAAHTAAGFIVLGAGFLCASLSGRAEVNAGQSLYWYIAPTTVAIAVVTIGMWQALVAQEDKQLRTALEANGTEAKNTFEVVLELQIQALERMANRWEHAETISRTVWEADAEGYYQHMKAFQAIEWVDRTYHVRWIVPKGGNEAAIGLDLSAEDRRRQAMDMAQSTRSTVLSEPIQLMQGGKGFLVFVPLFRNGEFDGVILGVYRFQALLEQMGKGRLVHGETLKLFAADEPLSQVKGGDVAEEYSTLADVKLRNVTWQLVVMPSKTRIASMRSAIPDTILASGATTVLFVAILIYLAGLRANAEQLRHRLERRFRQILEGAPVAMVVIDQSGLITMVNEELGILFGYRPDELIGKPVEILVPDRSRDSHSGFRTHYIQNAQRREMGAGRSLVGKHKDGTEIDVEVALAPLSDRPGDPPSNIVASIFDIRHRLATERLLEQQLTQISQVNKELDQFAYVASHDLKAPMRGIRQLANWITTDLGTDIPERTQRHLDQLNNRVGRLQSLLESLLAYSRIGRRGIILEKTDCKDCLQNIWNILAPPSAFSLKLEGDFPIFVTDKGAFEQVMLNALGNSLKHHDKESGEIIVVTKPQGAFHRFDIIDDGPGIAKEFHGKVFEMFQTLKPRDEVEGSGMGLALVRKTIEQIGGRVDIASDPNTRRGTTLQIYWPQKTKATEK